MAPTKKLCSCGKRHKDGNIYHNRAYTSLSAKIAEKEMKQVRATEATAEISGELASELLELRKALIYHGRYADEEHVKAFIRRRSK